MIQEIEAGNYKVSLTVTCDILATAFTLFVQGYEVGAQLKTVFL